jgi:hypothetical protein
VNLITTTEWKKQISEQELKRNQIYTELDGVTVEEIENYFIDKTYYDYITQ